MLDGIRSRAGTHAVLASVIAVVTAGTVVASGAGRTVGLVVPLLLLAAGTLPSSGVALGAQRRREASLLLLRGRRGPRWAMTLAAEPVLTAAVGGVLGAAVAIGRPTDRWLLVAAVWAGSTGIVVIAMLAVLHVPLPVLLAESRRGPGSPTPGGFARVLVAVATVIALLRRGPDAPDWVVHAGPTLVGLAAGITAVAVLRLAARWCRVRSRSPGAPDPLSTLLAGRRLGLPRAAAGLPVLVAAGTLAALAANTLIATSAWEDDTAAVAAGAPVVVAFDGEVQDLLATTREADPEGRWLMAAVRVFEDDRPTSRRVYLDTPRYDRVVGDFLDGTAAETGSAAVRPLADAASAADAEPTSSGGRLRVTVTSPQRRTEVRIIVHTVSADGGGPQEIRLRVPAGRSTSASIELARCDRGCRVDRMSVGAGGWCPEEEWAQPVCRRPQVLLSRIDLGGVDLLQRDWALAPPDGDEPPGEARMTDRGLEVRPGPAGESVLVPDLDAWSAPLLQTADIVWDDGPRAPTTSGLPRPATVVARPAVLPLVGTGGTVLDLSTSLDAGAGVAAAEPLVLARGDTPPEVLSAIGRPRTAEEFAAPALAAADVTLVRRLAAVATGGLLLGLLATLIAATRLRRDRTAERAALRLSGVPGTSLRRAGRLQVVLVASVAGLATLVGAMVAVAAFGTALPVLADAPAPLPLDTGPRAVPVLLSALLVAVAAGAREHRTVQAPEARSRPATLVTAGR